MIYFQTARDYYKPIAKAEKIATENARNNAPVMMFEYHKFTYSRDDIEHGLTVKSLLGHHPLNPRNFAANSMDEVDWAWVRDVIAYKQQLQFFADDDKRKAAIG